jgi:hypothetical protein
MEQRTTEQEEEKEMERIEFIMKAHTFKPIKPSKVFRKVDERIPYYTHPIWCAMTILYEENLNWETKKNGYLALLYHDILEDTTADLPKDLSPEVKKLIRELTFEGGTKQEKKEIWNKSKEARLCKLYDKISNLLDKRWLIPEKKKEYEKYTKKLCKDVERNFGELNITRIARAIINSYTEHDAMKQPETETNGERIE